jgi:hypothetical protein
MTQNSGSMSRRALLDLQVHLGPHVDVGRLMTNN